MYVGYILFGIISVSAAIFVGWTWWYRNDRVVTVSQPLFLALVALGVLVMASALLPLSQDDSGRQVCDTEKCIAICMSVPWLGFLGFTMTFSALFAKTWRINRIFKSKVGFGRVKITANDVIAPLALLLFSNTAVLLCWTLLDPLTYVRKPLEGTDGWNRVIATYGTCHSHHSAAYLIPLALMNVGVMLFANWQAFEARTIQSEFSESKYIAIAIASMLQAAFIGVPTLFTVRKSPEAYYLILTFMLFVISMAVLMLIFIPKIVIHQNFQRLSPAEQRQLIRESIRRSHSSFSMRQQQMMVAGGAQDLSVEFRNRRDAEGEHKDNEDGMLVVDAAHETNRTEAMSSSCTGRDDTGNEDTEAMSDAAFQLLPELTSLQEQENQVSITTPDARAHVDDQLLRPDV